LLPPPREEVIVPLVDRGNNIVFGFGVSVKLLDFIGTKITDAELSGCISEKSYSMTDIEDRNHTLRKRLAS
jgi:hypothetical protein